MTDNTESERSRGLRLMTLFGIEIRLDVSVTVIFFLIVYSLGSGVFPQWHPDWTPMTAWLTALAAGLLFFASLLAHELSHSLVARRFGIAVPRITLFLFGGMAEIESEARTPSAEFAIAIAGPLMSLALAVAFSLWAASAMDTAVLEEIVEDPVSGMPAASPFATACIWLSSVNFMLAIFNMVPGFPLDGGRVFRALIWKLTGDRLRATRYSANGGRIFGWLIMLYGFWTLFALQSLGGLWLLLIGWFLSHLASTSYTQTLTQRMLEPLTVADLMRTRFETIMPSLSVADFVDDHLLRTSQLLWPVSLEGRTLGFVSFDDVSSVAREQRPHTLIADVMTPFEAAPHLSHDDDAVRASSLLLQTGDRPLPVLKRGEVVGLLRGSDILKWMMLNRD